MSTVRRMVVRWWGQPFDNERARTFGDAILDMDALRRGIAISTAGMAVASLLALLSPVGPQGDLSVAVMAACSAAALPISLAWWRGPWPSERTSLAFAAFADLSIVGALLLYSNPLLAMPGTCLLVVVGLYLALLHRPEHVLAHVALGSSASLVLLVRVVTSGGDAAIGASMWLALQGGLVVVPVMLFAAWAPVRQAAWESMVDPLTGLMNRRGLEILAPRLPRPGPGRSLAVAVVDLDHFKQVNDEAGHSAGDEVLRRAAARLLSARTQGSLVARTGGEEFVCVAPVTDGGALGRHLVETVHDPRDVYPVTASVGVALVGGSGPWPDGIAAAERRADEAMYRAKRGGRNRYVVAGAPRPVPADS